MPLDEFFRTRIFEPLKMADTGFFLPKEKRDRLATVYSLGADGKIVRAPEPKMGQGELRRRAAGLLRRRAPGSLSTAADYTRFLQMLLNGGELDGVRLLGPKSIEMMTSNQVGRLYREDGGLRVRPRVRNDRGRRRGRPARFARRVRVGQRLLLEVLGRPEGEAGGGLPDPAHSRPAASTSRTSSATSSTRRS